MTPSQVVPGSKKHVRSLSSGVEGKRLSLGDLKQAKSSRNLGKREKWNLRSLKPLPVLEHRESGTDILAGLMSFQMPEQYQSKSSKRGSNMFDLDDSTISRATMGIAAGLRRSSNPTLPHQKNKLPVLKNVALFGKGRSFAIKNATPFSRYIQKECRPLRTIPVNDPLLLLLRYIVRHSCAWQA